MFPTDSRVGDFLWLIATAPSALTAQPLCSPLLDAGVNVREELSTPMKECEHPQMEFGSSVPCC